MSGAVHCGKSIRLDRFLSSQRESLTRSRIKELCRQGRITVDGKTVRDPAVHIDALSARVCVDGEPVEYRQHIYIMLNKPKGVVCSTRDGLSPTVLSLVPEEMRRSGLFPAGRLDKDTEGFVLITDDGELAHRMLSPKSHVAKTYYAELEKPCGEDYERAFASGLVISGGERCLPAEFIRDGERVNCCRVVLYEGKYHQVKRMFEALGNKVTYLKRLSIGSIELEENLPPGGCMEILHKDIEKIGGKFYIEEG